MRVNTADFEDGGGDAAGDATSDATGDGTGDATDATGTRAASSPAGGSSSSSSSSALSLWQDIAAVVADHIRQRGAWPRVYLASNHDGVRDALAAALAARGVAACYQARAERLQSQPPQRVDLGARLGNRPVSVRARREVVRTPRL